MTPARFPAALAVMQSGDLWVSKTVLLETEWVLRYSYELSRAAILDTFRKLLGYRHLQVEDRGTVLRALTWFGSGLDFANALHLASSHEADRFATFDRTLARAAAEIEGAPEGRFLGRVQLFDLIRLFEYPQAVIGMSR